MEIRNLVHSDLPALSSLYEQFWGEKSPIEKMEATFQRLSNNPNYLFLVAIRDGRLIGSAMGIFCEELYGGHGSFMVVEDVIVDNKMRRSGIGTVLMHALEKAAIDRGCGYILFVTEVDRTVAHDFYVSLGYKPDAYKGFKKRF